MVMHRGGKAPVYILSISGLRCEKLQFKQNNNSMNLANQKRKKPHKRLTYEAFFLNNGGPTQTWTVDQRIMSPLL